MFCLFGGRDVGQGPDRKVWVTDLVTWRAHSIMHKTERVGYWRVLGQSRNCFRGACIDTAWQGQTTF
jgi:hypothetical protein